MAIDVSALTAYTDAQLLTIVKNAIAEVTHYGRMLTVRERALERADLADLMKLRDDLEARIARTSGGRVVSYARRKRD